MSRNEMANWFDGLVAQIELIEEINKAIDQMFVLQVRGRQRSTKSQFGQPYTYLLNGIAVSERRWHVPSRLGKSFDISAGQAKRDTLRWFEGMVAKGHDIVVWHTETTTHRDLSNADLSDPDSGTDLLAVACHTMTVGDLNTFLGKMT